MKISSNYKLLVKFIISISLTIWLFSSIDYNTLINEFTSITAHYIAQAFLLILFIRLIMALRWKILLESFNIHPSYLNLVYIIFVSNSIGHVLPGGIGTDIIRSYQLAKEEGMAEKVAASVFIDRVFGFISMLMLAQVTSIYASIRYNLDPLIPSFIAVAFLGFILLYLMAKHLSKHRLKNFKSFKLTNKVIGFCNKIVISLKELDMSQQVIYKSFFLSLIVQVIRCFVFYIIFKSLSTDLDIVYFLVFIPVIFILMLLPISIGGLGVREASLFAFFGPLGVQLSTSTLAGLLFHSLQIVALIPGLVLFLYKK